ncbi:MULTISPECIES: hypothetical protein [Methylosinus]|uniref:Uncharacterized protein n=1 Tax=Methylosinus trichosporium (strain ATCC 35070 / NCIMB 11131 / UNIQEM 75 / OB3b) TaxID=595536 RepID=A0A2D2CZ59_METT3|nr:MULTISPECIES: hypothetical protein [Methylosinus]ATQ67995.1 hypothetical protein CQW49_08905 [Methylosinus trichosporium OB3b]OBS53725.1 hypothetical protein A8B73_04300 [Methylosinus sp. 3S-1]
MSSETFQTRGRRLVQDQFAGVAVQAINDTRVHDEIIKLAAQDRAFEIAAEQIDKVREFLTNPQNILGSAITKHGEIAEQVEVGIRNARQALAQENMTATFESVHRTGPLDYLINGVGVQSKFVNGIPNNLHHVLNHLDRYEGFTADGSHYIIPKDTHEAIQALLNGGNIDGLKASTEENIKALAKLIEEQTGKPFSEVVQPSIVNYPDVQVVKAPTTLDNEQRNLADKNEKLKDEIVDAHKPSLQGAAQAGLVGGAVGGALSLATGLYAKYRAGKNVFKGDFSAADWQELGLDTAKGAAGGAVAAGSIYLMTNYASMAAPFASAVVSGVKGLSSLAADYRNGHISFDEFVDLGMIVCAESAIVSVFTLVGQTWIPIPVLGAVIGSLAGKMVAEFCTEQKDKITQRLRDNMASFKATLDCKLLEVLETITDEFDRLNNLTIIAFDSRLNSNLRDRSVDLAMAYGVEADKIIANETALDKFMLA